MLYDAITREDRLTSGGALVFAPNSSLSASESGGIAVTILGAILAGE